MKMMVMTSSYAGMMQPLGIMVQYKYRVGMHALTNNYYSHLLKIENVSIYIIAERYSIISFITYLVLFWLYNEFWVQDINLSNLKISISVVMLNFSYYSLLKMVT